MNSVADGVDVATWVRRSGAMEIWLALAEDSGNPVQLWSADGRLVYANEPALELIGRRLEEARGLRVADFLPPEVARERADYLARAAVAVRPLLIIEHIGGVTWRALLRRIPGGPGLPTLVLAQMFRGADVARVRPDPRRYEVIHATHNQPGPLGDLSRRELEVLRLIGLGQTSEQMADRLQLSIKTIESFRARLARKTGIGSRSGLALLALQQGLVEVPPPTLDLASRPGGVPGRRSRRTEPAGSAKP